MIQLAKQCTVLAGVLAMFLVSASVLRAQAAPADMKDAITGTMDIKFNTRLNLDEKGKPQAGVKDQYNVNLTVAKSNLYSGTITRQPNLYGGGLIGRGLTQAAQYTFAIDLSVLNPADPSQKRTVGKWVGWLPIDVAGGVFKLDGARNADPEKDHGMRIAIDTVGKMEGFTEYFGGKLYGKAEKKDNLASKTYKRIVGTKEVEITVKRSDPMRFESLEIAAGPAKGSAPRTTVNGTLNYDYETGNYFADNIRFTYQQDGKTVEDKVSGTIKWIEDPGRKTNGKGRYEFNLRWNEDNKKPAAGEAAAFEKMKDEDAFFAADNTIPSLVGNVEYVDTMSGETVASSKVTYKLDANQLTKQQVINFAKLWMICTGPTNDE